MQYKFLMDPVKHNPNLKIEIVDKTIAKVGGECEDWKRVGTTEWFRCTTSTEMKFFHNRQLNVSVWECPKEIEQLVSVMEEQDDDDDNAGGFVIPGMEDESSDEEEGKKKGGRSDSEDDAGGFAIPG